MTAATLPKNRKGKLSMDDYVLAAALTQVVSIDLLVRDTSGKYLVGLRKNPPAQDTLFVPGGRVFKEEPLVCARDRIISAELGCQPEALDPEFKGIYEHYYTNENPGGGEGIDTHYVSLAFTVGLPGEIDAQQFAKQHADVHWLTPEDIRSSKAVHFYTKYFFMDDAPNRLV